MSQDLLSDQYDVIIVGAGAAGLYAALCLPSHLHIALITKDKIDRSASKWAQGGIAAAIAPDDSPNLHVEDTLNAGAGLCDADAVHYLANHAADCIQDLVSLGVAFDRKGDELALTLEAAHSRRRVLHAADTTGRAIVSTLIQQVIRRSNVDIFDDAFVFDLWLTNDRTACKGVCVLCGNEIVWISAQAVILATGGGGQVFSQTTNPTVSTGDGVAIAWRAGAILQDLEFVQFHPTALTKADAPRFLISEAVRGEGAHLIDHQGHRFVFDYHSKGELAPRDVVSRAIFDYLKSKHSLDTSGLAHVWLDLRPIDSDTIRRRFPNIIQVCKKWGIDLFKEPIPVAPAAHYWMGGIAVDLNSQSQIPGLYALGETASTGVHGANRLASNSLLECLVFGSNLRDIQLNQLLPNDQKPARQSKPSLSDLFFDKTEQSLLQEMDMLRTIRSSLPILMWSSAGISRNEQELSKAIKQIAQWEKAFADLSITNKMTTLHFSQVISLELMSVSLLKLWGETRNLINVANLILQSSRFRNESRGGHYRSDFPQTSSEWRAHTLMQGDRIWRSRP